MMTKTQKRKRTKRIIPFSEVLRTCPGMSPLQFINQTYPTAKVEVLSRGDIHTPSFLARIRVEGHEFSNLCSSKQTAKQNAALEAIKFLSGLQENGEPPARRAAREGRLGKPVNASQNVSLPTQLEEVVPTNEEPPLLPSHELATQPEQEGPPGPVPGPPTSRSESRPPPPEPGLGLSSPGSVSGPQSSGPGSTLPPTEPIESASKPHAPYVGWDPTHLNYGGTQKTPVSCLQELRTGDVTYEYLKCSEMEHSDFHFKAIVVLDSQTFEGYGSGKKVAKQNAAWRALDSLNYSGKCRPSTKVDPSLPNPAANETDKLSDRVYEAVMQKFAEVTSARPDRAAWKVLAGIVAFDSEKDSLTVLCVTTGAKNIGGLSLALNGSVVFDSHAEVLARRCFKRFCYAQLASEAGQDCDADCRIFEKSPTTNRLRLKNNIDLYLYISTSPCGDARVFAPNEQLCTAEDKNAGRSSRAVLRTKIECGEGTIPTTQADILQTFDGIMSGERLKTHSCSDKVMRWNLLGLQGALLSHFFEPIYLKGIVLGSLLHPSHMTRAVSGRMDSLRLCELPETYRVNVTRNTRISTPLKRQIDKSPSYGLNWTLGDGTIETIDSQKGLVEDGTPSRLCKRRLFELFIKSKGGRDSSPGIAFMTYEQAKGSSEAYQEVKKLLLTLLHKSGLGDWLSKPMECQQFTIEP